MAKLSNSLLSSSTSAAAAAARWAGQPGKLGHQGSPLDFRLAMISVQEVLGPAHAVLSARIQRMASSPADVR